MSYSFYAHLGARVAILMALDAIWAAAAVALCRKRSARLLAVGFALVQAGAIFAHYSLRRTGWDRAVPREFLAFPLVWHYLVLPLFLAVFAVGFLGGVGRRRRRPVASAPAEGMTRRQWLGLAVGAAPPLLAAGVSVGSIGSLDGLRVRRFELPVAGLPRSLDGLSIAQVSDLHVGGFTSDRVLNAMVESVRGLQPDLLVMTGDLVDFSLADFDRGLAALEAMPGRFGRLVIEGNHDVMDDAGAFARRIRSSRLRFLRDEAATIGVRGVPIQVFGLRWVGPRASGGDFLSREGYDAAMADAVREVLRQRDAGTFSLLLAHHPHAFDAAAQAGVPLTLAGHTHGGVLMVDRNIGVGPIFFRYWSGLYERGDSRLIVSNGVGNWFPLRVGAPAEVVSITLRSG